MKTRIFGISITLVTIAILCVPLLLGGCASSKETTVAERQIMQEEPKTEEGGGAGDVMYVTAATSIREGRSKDSKAVGKLKAGQRVKADFLEDDWYAVFDENATELSEENALGYVYAPLLKPVGGEWGEIKYVHSPTNMRKGRNKISAVVGKLKPGDKVKVDFLKHNWYAVFSPDETVRDEKNALGYVHAPLLKDEPPGVQ